MTPEVRGAVVYAVRNARGLNRDQFYDLGGWTAKSVARLANIELHDSWKDGDLEKVRRAFAALSVTDDEIIAFSARADDDLLSTGRAGRRKAADTADRSKRTPKQPKEPKNVKTRGVSSLMLSMPFGTYTRSDVFDSDMQETGVIELVHADLHAADDIAREFERRSITPMNIASNTTTATDRPRIDIPDGLYPITNGQINDYKRCKRKWWLTWYRKLGLASSSKTDARAIGTRIHRALEAWYTTDPARRMDPREAHETVLFQDWQTAISSAQRQADDLSVEAVNAAFKKVATLERAMIEGYVEWLRDTGEDANYEVLGAEQVVETTLDVQRHDGDVQSVHLMAKLDARLRRLSDGARLFIDHKTAASLDDIVPSLAMDPQMLFYHFMEWITTADGESRCDGALYNMLKKVKRTERATPPFYRRIEVHHNEHELLSFRMQLESTIADILNTVSKLDNNDSHHRVVPPTKSDTCKHRCDFFAVCTMFDDGSRAEDALSGVYTTIDPTERYDRGIKTGGTE